MIIEELRNDLGGRLSDDFDIILKYIENTLSDELPSTTIDNSYFIFACLMYKNDLLYLRLRENITGIALDAISDSYNQYLLSRSPSAIKPGRKIQISNEFYGTITTALSLLSEMNANHEKEYNRLTTDVILLSILSDMSDGNKIRKVFLKTGLTYDLLRKQIITKQYAEMPKKDLFEPKHASIAEANQNNNNNAFIISNGVPGQEISIVNGVPMLNPQGKVQQKGAYISRYCSNINDLVEQGKIDKLVGRKSEIDYIVRVLGRKKKNNAILVGGEGVGKTAICEGLAYLIVNKQVPYFLLNKKVISLDMTSLMAGTTLRGMFEERVKGILDEIKADGNFILFIDNIGDVLGTNDGKSEYDVASMLSHSLENGECQVIGACDFKSYRRTFDKDKTLGRRFQKIIVEKPSVIDSITILNGIKSSYEDYHNVKYTDEAIRACVILSDKYMSEKNLPDSAIDVMDEIGSVKNSWQNSDEVNKIIELIGNIDKQLEVNNNDKKFEEVDRLTIEKRKAEKVLNETIKSIEKEKKGNPIIINEGDIQNLISEKTGIPLSQLSSSELSELGGLNDRIKARVIGQDEGVDIICNAIKRNRIGLRNSKSISAIIFGSTGVGKCVCGDTFVTIKNLKTNELEKIKVCDFVKKTSTLKLRKNITDEKFIKIWNVKDFQILTDTGFVDITSLGETIPYEVYSVETRNGKQLRCADNHIVFNSNYDEVFVKDLNVGDWIMTDDGASEIIKIEHSSESEHMYDFSLADDSNHRYYTNGILSHNTYLAKNLARELFGSEKQLVRFDMSEYPDKTAVNKLIGSNPGYVGYEDGGLLTETIKNKKHCVLLLDEIEKADKEVYNIFLQVLDEGFLTDNSGQKVDFSNVVVLFTSNVGAKEANDFKRGIGFDENEDENKQRILSKNLKNRFPPEFINRLDNIIYFNSLSDDNLRHIIKLEMENLVQRAKDIKYSLTYDDSVIDYIFKIINKDREYGARPIKRAIQDNIEDKITDAIIRGEIKDGQAIRCTVENDELKIV